MEKQNKSISLKGIVRNKPLQQAADGDCQEMINLRFKNGAFREVHQKMAFEKSLLSASAYDRVWLPGMLPDDYYLCQRGQSVLLVESQLTAQCIEHEVMELSEGEQLKQITWLNNVLMAYTSLGVHYLIYNQTGNISTMLTALGKLQMPRIQVGEMEYDRYVLGYTNVNQEDYIVQPVTYFTDGMHLLPDTLQSLQSLFIEKLAEKRQEGFFYGNVSFMMAYKLFNGDLILHSGPFVWNVGWNGSGENDIPHYYTQNSDIEQESYWRLWVTLGKPRVQYSYSAEQVATLERYKQAGLLRSLCIFMSPDRSGYDMMEQDVFKYRRAVVDDPFNPFPGENLVVYVPPFDQEVFRNVADATNYYLVKELPIDELLNTNYVNDVVLTLDKGMLSAIETQPTMQVDNFTHHQLVPEVDYVYNSRLHLADLLIVPGKMPTPLVHAFHDAFPRYSTITDIEAVLALYHRGLTPVMQSDVMGSLKLFLLAEIVTGGATYRTLKELQTEELTVFTNGEGDYYALMRPFNSYPDVRATRWMLLANNPTIDAHMKICQVSDYADQYALEPLSFHNAACYMPDLQPHDGEMWLPTKVLIPTDAVKYNACANYDIALVSTIWYEHNRLQVSEVNNCLFFPAKQSYRIGNPDAYVRALMVAQEQMSESQFGQFPLYCFTSQGIYALEYQGGEVLYTRIVQFTNDTICRSVRPLVVSGGAIIFQEESGVKVLSGRQSKLISEEVTENIGFSLLSHPLMDKLFNDRKKSVLTPYMDINPIKAQLLSAPMGYDEQLREVLFALPSYTLVLQLDTMAWYKRTDTYNGFIRKDNHHLGLVKSAEGALFRCRFMQMHLEDGYMTVPYVGMITRPFNFDINQPKILSRLMARFSGINRLVSITKSRMVVNYGWLYNMIDLETLVNGAVWRIPTRTDFLALFTAIGCYYTNGMAAGAGQKLKSAGFTYWNTGPNAGIDSVSFDARGAGYRTDEGVYSFIGAQTRFATSTLENFFNVCMELTSADQHARFVSSNENFGVSIRLCRAATLNEQQLPNGTAVEGYTDNGGRLYKAVRIGALVWTAENLIDNLKNDQLEIPLVTLSPIWAGTKALNRCAYKNNNSIAGILQNTEIPQYNTAHSLIVMGSQDGQQWYPVAGVEVVRNAFSDVLINRLSGSYRYFALAYAGRGEQVELRQIDVLFEPRYSSKMY